MLSLGYVAYLVFLYKIMMHFEKHESMSKKEYEKIKNSTACKIANIVMGKSRKI